MVILAFGQLAAGLGIYYRHAIPRSPRLFHWLTLPPMIIMVVTDFALAWMALTGWEAVMGLDGLSLLFLYFFCAAFTWWALVAYAVFHYRRTHKLSKEGIASIEKKIDHAKREAEDRFSEAELEKTEVRARLDEDAASVKRDLEESQRLLDERLTSCSKRMDIIIEELGKER